jgi:hypothetical protein
MRTGMRTAVQTGVMQQAGAGTASQNIPLLVRFLAKFTIDILPAALASVIGGFLFTQYHLGRTPDHPALVQVAPASDEMMQIVRDEHTLIVDYLKAQTAAEKSKLAAMDQDDARAVADAKAAAATADAKAAAAAAAAKRLVAAAVPPKPAAPRSKPITVVATAPAPQAPLVIAQAGLPSDAVPAAEAPRDPDSLLAKTVDFKDHVVAATRKVVTAIGDIPSWLAWRMGGANPPPASDSRMFSS